MAEFVGGCPVGWSEPYKRGQGAHLPDRAQRPVPGPATKVVSVRRREPVDRRHFKSESRRGERGREIDFAWTDADRVPVAKYGRSVSGTEQIAGIQVAVDQTGAERKLEAVVLLLERVDSTAEPFTVALVERSSRQCVSRCLSNRAQRLKPGEGYRGRRCEIVQPAGDTSEHGEVPVRRLRRLRVVPPEGHRDLAGR